MGVFRYLDRYQTSVREAWRKAQRDGESADELMGLLENRDRDLENYLERGSVGAARMDVIALSSTTLSAPVNVPAAITFIFSTSTGPTITGVAGDVVVIEIETAHNVAVAVPYVNLAVQAYLSGAPTAVSISFDMGGAVGVDVTGYHRSSYTLPSDGTYTFTSTGITPAGNTNYHANYNKIHLSHLRPRGAA